MRIGVNGNQKKWTPLLWSSLFLGLLGLAALWTVRETKFADLNFRQPQSDRLTPVYSNHALVQTFSNLDADTLIIYPQAADLLQAVRAPLRVSIHFGSSGEDDSRECSSLAVFFTHKCKLTGLLRGGGQENPVSLSISTAAPEGVFWLWSSRADAYPEGILTAQGEELSGDLEFSGFQPFPSGARWMSALRSAGILWGFTLLCWGIGSGWLRWLLRGRQCNQAEVHILALFLGAAAVVLGLAGLSVLKIPFLPAGGVGFSVCIGLAIFMLLRGFSWPPRFSFDRDEIFLFLGLGAAILTSSLQAAGLLAPLWVDGLNHQRFLENIVEAQNLFVDPAYPTGFHALAYFAHAVFGISLPESILLAGQWVIAVSGLSFFLLARKLFAPAWAAWIAAALYWFCSPFPDYLLNWSRFPFAMGLALLPLGIYLVLRTLEQARFAWLTIICALTLALAHYGAFVFWIAGCLPVVFQTGKGSAVMKKRSWWLVAAALSPAVIYLAGRAAGLASSGDWQSLIQQTRSTAASVDWTYSLGTALQHGGWLIWVLALAGVFVSFRGDKAILRFTAAWTMLSFLAAGAQQIFLGAAVSSWTNLLFFSFLPACLLGAQALAALIRFLRDLPALQSSPPYLRGIRFSAPFVLMAACLLAGYYQSAMLNPQTVMVTQGDQTAYRWIQSNTPEAAVFVVNTFRWGGEMKPVDGGGWIHAFTQRRILYPQIDADRQDLMEFIRHNPIDYLYLGKGSGSFRTEWFDGFPILYQRDGITIIRVSGTP